MAMLAYGLTSCKPGEIHRVSGERMISGHELDHAEWAEDGHAEWVKTAYAKWLPLRPAVKALKGRGADDKAMEAKASLPAFKAAFRNPAFSSAAFAVKIAWRTPMNPEPASIWLGVMELTADRFETCALELPEGPRDLVIGHVVGVSDGNIKDWMIVHEGTLYGGYSLGLFRSSLSEKDRVNFDRQLNVKRFVHDLP